MWTVQLSSPAQAIEPLCESSLGAAVRAAAPLTLGLYGTWMFSIVLVWDVFVAVVLGSRRALARMDRILAWLTRLSGGFLVLFG
ncbi:hypothetical protein GCM10009754_09550 [Amycolatopsis minnesotensis]|uniref:LysE type translocator n=1 Tax=Amycolatopsis minnesotensis TaxID=337894 RepID=A0ABP5BG40_9PSEU